MFDIALGSRATRKYPRRPWLRLRFSMRALLLLTTVICVVAGFYVRRAEDQRRTVAMIREVNGQVYYDFEMNEMGTPIRGPEAVPRPPGPAWLRERLGIDFFASVVRAEVNRLDEQESQQLRQLRHLPKLRQLEISDCPVDDRFVEQLAGLRHLDEIRLIRTNVTGSGFVHFRSTSSLRQLDLTGSLIENRHIHHLTKFRQLHWLALTNTPVTDACVPSIKQIPALTSVDVDWTGISPEARERLSQSLQVFY